VTDTVTTAGLPDLDDLPGPDAISYQKDILTAVRYAPPRTSPCGQSWLRESETDVSTDPLSLITGRWTTRSIGRWPSWRDYR